LEFEWDLTKYLENLRKHRVSFMEAPTGVSLGDFIMKQPKLSDLKLDPKGTEQIRRRATKSQKIKITINIDQDIIASLKKRSDISGVPYQNLLNSILRAALNDAKPDDTSSRLNRLERELAAIKKKLTA
jgi:predicted DNA binding CopG/RHH family protein